MQIQSNMQLLYYLLFFTYMISQFKIQNSKVFWFEKENISNLCKENILILYNSHVKEINNIMIISLITLMITKQNI